MDKELNANISKNVKILTQLRDEKIGDIEKLLGKSQGIISRWGSTNHKSVVSASDLYILSKHFGISSDDLMSTDAVIVYWLKQVQNSGIPLKYVDNGDGSYTINDEYILKRKDAK